MPHQKRKLLDSGLDGDDQFAKRANTAIITGFETEDQIRVDHWQPWNRCSLTL
jgi:hypothetical protein